MRYVMPACIQGRQARLPFEDSNSSYKLMELVHSDNCGPIQPMSLGRVKYIIMFMDYFSQYPMCYFLKMKDRQVALDAFEQYKAWAENQMGKYIKTLYTDSGGEYVNGEFQEFLNKIGISHEKTMQHAPQSNGLAE